MKNTFPGFVGLETCYRRVGAKGSAVLDSIKPIFRSVQLMSLAELQLRSDQRLMSEMLEGRNEAPRLSVLSFKVVQQLHGEKHHFGVIDNWCQAGRWFCMRNVSSPRRDRASAVQLGKG
jgi:hypothetical protein